MKNSFKCAICSTDNPLYESICRNCGAYLRDRVYNIDLGKAISRLITEPTYAFKQFIYAEHKNFIIFIILFLAAKLLIDVRFLSALSIGEFNATTGMFISYLIVIATLILSLLFYSLFFKLVNNVFGIETRFRDNLTVLVYALLPGLLGLIFLFPLELVVFGEYLFSVNPSPFFIKPTFAYIFLGIEILIKLWNVLLLFKAFKVQTGAALPAVVYTVIFIMLLSMIYYFLSLMIFTL